VLYKARVLLRTNRRAIFNNWQMNSPKTGLRVASAFFGIFAIVHLLRLINQAQVTIGTLTIPMSISWIALIVAAILCVWLWRLASAR
jgi:hypothetical protein